jgi:hypothetical protein
VIAKTDVQEARNDFAMQDLTRFVPELRRRNDITGFRALMEGKLRDANGKKIPPIGRWYERVAGCGRCADQSGPGKD